MAGTLSEIKDVVGLATSVLKLGEGWYRASGALEEFKSKVAKLERKYESWQKKARTFGLSSENSLRSLLQEAKEQLKREEARLKSLECGCGCLCLYSSCGTDFPDHLGKSVIDLDNEISANWKANDDARAAARKRAELLARQPKFNFERDPRYVRIPAVEEELKKTLETEGRGNGAVRVVLLHGRAGTGKSSMARNLALDYKEAVTSFADGSASSSSHGCRQFDDVLYLECGLEADTKAKQAELCRMVDWEMLSGAERDIYNDPDKVRAKLQQLLKERCSLIIFDDVWEEKFLKNMVGICGEELRILVTSQKKDLCHDSLVEATKSVSMHNVAPEDSLKILKVYTGFSADDDVPESVKECMNSLVEKASGHPHALASIAVAIDQGHKTQLRQWKDVMREYDQLLNKPLSIQTEKPLHDVKYERTVTEAIQMKFNLLGEEERMLLILMVMLGDYWTAEEILQLLYGEVTTLDNAKGLRSSSAFSNARKRLENLHCIRTHDAPQYILPDSTRSSTDKLAGGLYWSIHSLDEEFIEKRMEDDINNMLKTVNCLPDKIQGLETKVQVHAAKFMGTFFKSKWAKKIEVSKKKLLETPGPDSAHMLPVIRLMAKNIEKGWNKNFQNSADQVFLSFMSEGVVHKEAVKNLLSSSISQRQIWSWVVALSDPYEMAEGSRVWSVDEDLIVSILSIFGHLDLSMDNSDTASLNLEQCKALVLLLQANFQNAKSCVFHMRKLVLGFIEMLRSPSCSELFKDFGAVVISYLIPLMQDRPFEYGREGSAMTPMIVKRLVSSFQRYDGRSFLEIVTYRSVQSGLVVVHVPVDRLDHICAGQALVDLVRRSNSDVRQELINNGFREVVDILGDKKASFISRARACEVVDYLCSDQIEISFGASKTKYLSDCLANIIEEVDKENRYDADDEAYLAITLLRLSGEMNRASRKVSLDYKYASIRLLMQIDPATASGMVLRSSDALGARGAELVRVGRYQDALIELGKAQQLAPQNFKYYHALSVARDKLEDWEGALKDCDSEERHTGAAKSSEEWSEFYRRKSSVKRKAGNFPGALEDLDKSLDWSPDNFRALMDRGEVKFYMGDKEGARAAAKEKAKGEAFWFGSGVDLRHRSPNPSHITHRSNLKCLLGDLPGGLEDINKSLQLFPYEYLEIVRRGYVKFCMGDEEGARADAEDNRAQADIQEEVFHLGFNPQKQPFLFGFKGKNEAFRIGFIDNVLISVRYWGLFYQERGVLKRLVGNLHAALEDLDKGLQLGPNDYEVLKQRAYVKFLMDDEEGARADAERALRFRPRRADRLGYEDGCLGTSTVEFLDFRL